MNSKNENNYNITLDIENCEIDKNINAKFYFFGVFVIFLIKIVQKS